MQFTNTDLHNLVTPVHVDKFIGLLRESGYSQTETQFLEDGFRFGFDIGYQGPQCRQSTASNLPLRVGSKIPLWNKLMKEVSLGRVAGPFRSPPFENYIQSPLGLVPKKGSDGT